MRNFAVIAAISTLTGLGSTALAQTTDGAQAAPAPAPASVAPASAATEDKKIAVGADLQFILPVGDMADVTGPQIGPLVHVGYRIIPPLELTGRLGYLFGLSKSQTISVLGASASVDTSISNFPIWLGARYFFMDPSAGLYGAAELALNIMSAKESANGTSMSNGVTREGFNLGVGYVISKDLPIDIRVQYSLFNLLGKDTGESSLMGLGISAGYTWMF